MRIKRTINKIEKKRSEKVCHLCPNDDYSQLDVHRIVPGELGGKYTNHNTVILCVSCHRRVHAGQITIERWYSTSAGRKVLHYWENGEEKWQ